MKKLFFTLALLLLAIPASAASDTLWNYYQGHLPSLSDRVQIAQQAGISNYKGTKQQNTELLAYLQGQKLGSSVLPVYGGGTGLASVSKGQLLIGASTNVYTQIASNTLPYGTLASSTAYNTFYHTPSTRITAGASCSWSGNTFNCPGGEPLWRAASTTLSTSNFSSANISQWTNNSNYLTSSGNFHGTWGGYSTTTLPGLVSSASTTQWNTFYHTPSNRITAGSNCSWTGNSFNCAGGGATTTLAHGYILAGNASNLGAATSTIFLYNGKVGIGTTTPAATKIELYDNSTSTDPTLYIHDDTPPPASFSKTSLVVKTKESIGFGWIANFLSGNGSIEAMAIANDGYVGIGTSTPQQPLSVGKSGVFTVADSGAVTGLTWNGLTASKGAGTGLDNIAIGTSGLSSNTTGYGNIAVGTEALRSNTIGVGNVAVGYVSQYYTTEGLDDIGIGGSAGYYNTIGSYNNNVGAGAGYHGISGSYNNNFGLNAGYYNTTGSGNVNIGFAAGYHILGSNNVTLGNSAGSYETGTSTFYVNNQDRTNLAGDRSGSLFYGTFNATPANQTLHINASTTIAQNLTVSGGNINGVPFIASTTQWNTFYHTPSNRISVGGNLAWSGNTLQCAANYSIPLTASSTNWDSFYHTPSGRISAGTGLAWSGNTFGADATHNISLTASTSQWNSWFHASTTKKGWADFSNTATGLTYTNTTGATSLTSGYIIPLTASTTQWNNWYHASTTKLSTTLAHGNIFAGNSSNIAVATSTIFLQNGNVGIGTTGPVSKLHVYGASDLPLITAQSGIFRIESPNTGLNIGILPPPNGSYIQTTDTPDSNGKAFVLALNPMGGNVGIGTTTPGSMLDVYGTIRQKTVKSCTLGLTTDANGGITGCVVSDERLKNNIISVDYSALDIIEKLKPVNYSWISTTTKDNQIHSGFLAQDVEKVFPTAISNAGTDDQGNILKGIDSNAMVSLLVKGIQEQQVDINKLKGNKIGSEASIGTSSIKEEIKSELFNELKSMSFIDKIKILFKL